MALQTAGDVVERCLRGCEYSYDGAAGRVTGRSCPDGDEGYEYDALGRLVGYTAPGVAIAYTVDAEGHRLCRTEGTATTCWIYPPGGLLPVAQTENGVLVARYVYAGGLVPVYAYAGGVAYALVFDHLGSLRRMVRVSDGTTLVQDYDEFGVPLDDGIAGNDLPDWIPFGFAGGMRDHDTPLATWARASTSPRSGASSRQTR